MLHLRPRNAQIRGYSTLRNLGPGERHTASGYRLWSLEQGSWGSQVPEHCIEDDIRIQYRWASPIGPVNKGVWRRDRENLLK
jgi:hypothetical protein